LFGLLDFALIITVKRKNIFFNFICSSSYVKNKIFSLLKLSCGIANRDSIRKKTSPKVLLRGRIKSSFARIKEKYMLMQNYITYFAKIHPLMCSALHFSIIYKVHNIDYNFISLLGLPFNLRYNYHDFYSLTSETHTYLVEPTEENKWFTPAIYRNIIFKFPHNGCRPKKVRRVRLKK